jgi:hypothetical protein
MTKQLSAILIGAALLLPAARPLAAQQSPWIHVHVQDQGDKASKVQVNLPLSLVEAAAGLMPRDMGEHIRDGKIQLKNTDISVADLRRLWHELRAAGNAEFVTVEEKDQRVRVARQGSQILINVDDLSGKQSKVRIEVPMDVIDALLEGEGSQLNLEAAIKRLQTKRGELIQVQDGDTHVRIWIDERS